MTNPPVDEAAKSGRDGAGRFVPGHGMGRPKGSRNKLNVAVLDQLADLTSPAVSVLRKHVNEGSLKAACYILDRFTSPERHVAIGTTDPNAVADALADGLITPGEGARIAAGLKTLREASDLAELRAKMDDLEELISRMKARP